MIHLSQVYMRNTLTNIIKAKSGLQFYFIFSPKFRVCDMSSYQLGESKRMKPLELNKRLPDVSVDR